MDIISSALKCVNCKEMLNLPVLLPCGHSICKKHAPAGAVDAVSCGQCGRKHMIPNEGLPDNEPLAVIIATQIPTINAGKTHEKVIEDCESLESLISKAKNVLDDQLYHTQQEVNKMKHKVNHRRKELKLKIDLESEKLIKLLDDYVDKSNDCLKEHENFKRLEISKNNATTAILKTKAILNRVNIDDEFWNISNAIDSHCNSLNHNMNEFKRSLILPEFALLKAQTKLFSELNLDFSFISK